MVILFTDCTAHPGSSSGVVVLKILACGTRSPGFDSWSHRYDFRDLLPSRDMAEVPLKQRKSSVQPTKCTAHHLPSSKAWPRICRMDYRPWWMVASELWPERRCVPRAARCGHFRRQARRTQCQSDPRDRIYQHSSPTELQSGLWCTVSAVEKYNRTLYIKQKSRGVCETLEYAPGGNEVEKAIFSFKVKVKVIRSLTLVSFVRASLVEYACQVWSLYLLGFKSYSEG